MEAVVLFIMDATVDDTACRLHCKFLDGAKVRC
jgi:hypothetical protein